MSNEKQIFVDDTGKRKIIFSTITWGVSLCVSGLAIAILFSLFSGLQEPQDKQSIQYKETPPPSSSSSTTTTMVEETSTIELMEKTSVTVDMPEISETTQTDNSTTSSLFAEQATTETPTIQPSPPAPESTTFRSSSTTESSETENKGRQEGKGVNQPPGLDKKTKTS